MKKCILVDGYVRGKVALRVLELLGLESMYEVDEVEFSSSSSEGSILYEDGGEESYLSTDEAYRCIVCNDKIYELVYEEGYPESGEIIFETPVVVEDSAGDKFEVVAALLGMDEWGLGVYEG